MPLRTLASSVLCSLMSTYRIHPIVTQTMPTCTLSLCMAYPQVHFAESIKSATKSALNRHLGLPSTDSVFEQEYTPPASSQLICLDSLAPACAHAQGADLEHGKYKYNCSALQEVRLRL